MFQPLLLAALLSAASPLPGDSFFVTSCNLGCSNGSGGQQVGCSIVNLPFDAPLSFTWSEPVDLSSVSFVSFLVVDVVTGGVPPGAFKLKDSHTIMFTPSLDGGPLSWSANSTYLIRISGTAQGDAPPYVTSTTGNANLSRVQCTVSPNLPPSNVANQCGTTANSAGPGACMGWTGLPSIASNSFSLSTAGLPAGKPGLYLASNSASITPFGDGTLCLAQVGVFRLPPAVSSDVAGFASMAIDWTGLSTGLAIAPGQTVYFQLLYRDPAAGPAGFNLSDSLRVDLTP